MQTSSDNSTPESNTDGYHHRNTNKPAHTMGNAEGLPVCLNTRGNLKQPPHETENHQISIDSLRKTLSYHLDSDMKFCFLLQVIVTDEMDEFESTAPMNGR